MPYYLTADMDSNNFNDFKTNYPTAQDDMFNTGFGEFFPAAPEDGFATGFNDFFPLPEEDLNELAQIYPPGPHGYNDFDDVFPLPEEDPVELAQIFPPGPYADASSPAGSSVSETTPPLTEAESTESFDDSIPSQNDTTPIADASPSPPVVVDLTQSGSTTPVSQLDDTEETEAIAPAAVDITYFDDGFMSEPTSPMPYSGPTEPFPAYVEPAPPYSESTTPLAALFPLAQDAMYNSEVVDVSQQWFSPQSNDFITAPPQPTLGQSFRQVPQSEQVAKSIENSDGFRQVHHPAQVVIDDTHTAETTTDADTDDGSIELHFATLDEAMRHVDNRTLSSTKNNDWQIMESNPRPFVISVIKAFDSNGTNHPGHPSPIEFKPDEPAQWRVYQDTHIKKVLVHAKSNSLAIELAAWKVFKACIDAHKLGIKNVKNGEFRAKCSERFGQVVQTLADYAIFRWDVVRDQRIEELVRDPGAAVGRKVNNWQGNTSKKRRDGDNAAQAAAMGVRYEPVLGTKRKAEKGVGGGKKRKRASSDDEDGNERDEVITTGVNKKARTHQQGSKQVFFAQMDGSNFYGLMG